MSIDSASLRQINQLDPNAPLIVFGNHPGWWDPLTAHLVCDHCFANREFYAPIDARALRRYRVFGKLGFFGIDLDSLSGASQFLRACQLILQRPGSSLWLTPEGRFCDPRDRTAKLMPGLAHLCHRAERGAVIAMAMEYPFWEERLPEMLLCLSDPILIDEHVLLDKCQWSDMLESTLRTTQDRLAEISIHRDVDALTVLMRGGRGSGFAYDMARRFVATLRGERYQSTHGEKLQ